MSSEYANFALSFPQIGLFLHLFQAGYLTRIVLPALVVRRHLFRHIYLCTDIFLLKLV